MTNRLFIMIVSVMYGFFGMAYCADPFMATSDTGETYFYREGTLDDIPKAQEHYIAFHERRYANDADREFKNPREEIAARFALNAPLIANKTLKFFVLEKVDGAFSGYSIVHVVDQPIYNGVTYEKTIYSIQTAIYIKGVGGKLKDFLKTQVPDAQRHVFFIWKPTIAKFPDMKKNTGGKECDDVHPFLANPAVFYEQEGLLPLSESYQGFEQIFENYKNI